MGEIKSLQVVLKISERCNINCDYCYMFNAGNTDYVDRPAIMSLETVKKVAEYLLVGAKDLGLTHITIVFHGGEPLMYKKTRFSKMCDILIEKLSSSVEITFGIQTNAILIDQDWIDLFAHYQIAVGVSIDGPKIYHDKHRLDHKGLGTYEKTMLGFNSLQKSAYQKKIKDVGVLSVANPSADARLIYSHIVHELGVKRFNINFPMETFETIVEKDIVNISKFYCDLFEAWTEDDNPEIEIRFFSEIIRVLLGDRKFSKALRRKNIETLLIVISSDGGVSEDDDYKILNFGQFNHTVWDSTLLGFSKSELMMFINSIYEHIPAKCKECDWVNYCGGGVALGLVSSKYSKENGFNNESVFCSALQEIYYKVAKYLLKNGYAITQLHDALKIDSETRIVSDTNLSIPQHFFSKSKRKDNFKEINMVGIKL